MDFALIAALQAYAKVVKAKANKNLRGKIDIDGYRLEHVKAMKAALLAAKQMEKQ